MTNADLSPVTAATGAIEARNSPLRVLFASLVGTTIEFFDFYIYATAAVLVFPKLFFPASDAVPRRSNRSPLSPWRFSHVPSAPPSSVTSVTG